MRGEEELFEQSFRIIHEVTLLWLLFLPSCPQIHPLTLEKLFLVWSKGVTATILQRWPLHPAASLI